MIKQRVEYLYIGSEKSVRCDELIGIFDMDNTTVSKHTRKFLNNAEKEKKVVLLTYDIPESFVLCDSAVYLVQPSPRTLAARSKSAASAAEAAQ